MYMFNFNNNQQKKILDMVQESLTHIFQDCHDLYQFVRCHVVCILMCIFVFAVSQDAHNCIPEFDEETAMFSVYDGHGGNTDTYSSQQHVLFLILRLTLLFSQRGNGLQCVHKSDIYYHYIFANLYTYNTSHYFVTCLILQMSIQCVCPQILSFSKRMKKTLICS